MKKNKFLLGSSLLLTSAIVLAACNNDTDNNKKEEKSEYSFNKNIMDNLEENKTVLDKKEINKYLEDLEKKEELIKNADTKFINSLDVQLAVKYQDASLYYKYLIRPLLLNENKSFDLSNTKFAYQKLIITTLNLNEEDFNNSIEAMKKGIDEKTIEGTSVADKKLINELNRLLEKEADLIKQIYDAYKVEGNSIVLKEGKEPVSVALSSALEDYFYKENELSNHYVQYTLAFDLYQFGKTTDKDLTDLIEILNSDAYFKFAYLDELVANMSIDSNRETVKLDTENKEFLLKEIEKNINYLKEVSDSNQYKKEMTDILNNFKTLVSDGNKTFKEISDWYLEPSKVVSILSRDSVRNSFFLLQLVEEDSNVIVTDEQEVTEEKTEETKK